MQDKGTLRNLKNSPGRHLSASQYINIALVHFSIFGGNRVDMSRLNLKLMHKAVRDYYAALEWVIDQYRVKTPAQRHRRRSESGGGA